eukprot:COSAG04_NODE_123_length_24709_cov_113.457294_15_plen_194_part_00
MAAPQRSDKSLSASRPASMSAETRFTCILICCVSRTADTANHCLNKLAVDRASLCRTSGGLFTDASWHIRLTSACVAQAILQWLPLDENAASSESKHSSMVNRCISSVPHIARPARHPSVYSAMHPDTRASASEASSDCSTCLTQPNADSSPLISACRDFERPRSASRASSRPAASVLSLSSSDTLRSTTLPH